MLHREQSAEKKHTEASTVRALLAASNLFHFPASNRETEQAGCCIRAALVANMENRQPSISSSEITDRSREMLQEHIGWL
ncbi:hypothetical protein PSU44_20945, partial [Yersinia pestis]|nr:hypothetical protein [Yersinia pestis]